MTRQQRQMLAVIVVLAGTGYFLYSRQAQRPVEIVATGTPAPEAKKPEVSAGQVLRAREDINPFETPRVSGDKVDVVTDYPEEMVPKDVLRNANELDSLILTSPVYRGEVLTRGRFVSPSEIKDKRLGDFIQKGYRAVSVEVDEITGTAGFIQQGDVVDLVGSYRVPQSDRQITRIILQKVTVLARGPAYLTRPQRSAPGKVTGATGNLRFTLLVEPKLCAQLVHVIDERGANRFKLILRNPDDKERVQTAGILLREVLSDIPRALERRKKQDTQVEVVRGRTVTLEFGPELPVLVSGGTGLAVPTGGSGAEEPLGGPAAAGER